MKVTVEKINKEYMARPAGQSGNIGHHPYPWIACYGSTATEALQNFEYAHKKHWSK